MGGIAGQYFKQFGLTVAVAVFFSLLVARLITPMLAAYFLRGHGHAEPKPGLVMRGYLALLKVTLRFRWLTLLGGIGFFAGSIYAIGFLPSGFIPEEDASRIIFSLELPPGSRLEDTRAATDQASKLIREVPEVENVYVIGGVQPAGHAGAAPRHRRRRPDPQVEARAHPGRDRRDPARASSTRSRTCAPISSTTAASGSWRSA